MNDGETYLISSGGRNFDLPEKQIEPGPRPPAIFDDFGDWPERIKVSVTEFWASRESETPNDHE